MRLLRIRCGLIGWAREELCARRYRNALSLFCAAFKGDLT